MPPNLIILILLLGVAAAAIIGTVVFVRVVDRRLEREAGGPGDDSPAE